MADPVSAPEAPKRGRGRPPKANKPEPSPAGTGRPRGRPRKVDATVAVASGRVTKTPGAARGRPRKASQPQETAKAAALHDAVSTPSDIPPVKKARGRPRLNPDAPRVTPVARKAATSAVTKATPDVSKAPAATTKSTGRPRGRPRKVVVAPQPDVEDEAEDGGNVVQSDCLRAHVDANEDPDDDEVSSQSSRPYGCNGEPPMSPMSD